MSAALLDGHVAYVRTGMQCAMQIGHILYSGIMPWLVADGTAGTMVAPIVFAMLMLLGAVILLALYVATQASPCLRADRMCPHSAHTIVRCHTLCRISKKALSSRCCKGQLHVYALHASSFGHFSTFQSVPKARGLL